MQVIATSTATASRFKILYLAGVHRAAVGSATPALTIVGVATIDKVMAIRRIWSCKSGGGGAYLDTPWLLRASIVVLIRCRQQVSFMLFGELEKWREPRSWDVIGHRYGILWGVTGHVMGCDGM